MPYIKPEAREGIDLVMSPIFTLVKKTPNKGALNYIITKILLATEPEKYDDFNSLVGVLECVKLELYRRVIAPYEDEKRVKTGDLFRWERSK